MDVNKGIESDKDCSTEQDTKIKPKTRNRKRKRNNSNSSTDLDDVLPENTLEIEKSLHAAAIKNNLDDISVKKILKKGVPLTKNEVLLLVQLVRANKIVTDKTTNATNNRLKEEAWSTISDQFNASVSSCNRRPEQLRLKWENLKKAARKRNSSINSNQYKKVVTNDHVLALVKLREEEEDSGTEEGLQPKLTRSKVKELMKVSPSSAPWNSIELTPIKHIPVKTRPEVKALIAQELPDDEDDDEYEPVHDESDDDHALESCSDLESQPRTPATPRKQTNNTDVVQDGPFKVPQKLSSKAQKKLEEEEATIALRTRSKLCLSSTPIEHIESSFVPPDDLPTPAVDDLWNNFLEECLNPASNARHEDDDDADPEYNIAADPDANEEDEEALENSILKISQKELNDLVTELFSVLPQGAEEQLAGGAEGEFVEKPLWEGKQEPISDEEMNLSIINKVERRDSVSIGKVEMEDGDAVNVDNVLTTSVETQTLHTSVSTSNSASSTVKISVVEHRSSVLPPPSPRLRPAPLRLLQQNNTPPDTLHVTVDPQMQIYPEQVLILQQQLRQHIQLATTYFLQLFVHPVHWSYAPKYKEFLESLEKLTLSNPKSVANVCNLRPALELVKGWEDSVSQNTPDNVLLVEFIQTEVEKSRKRVSQNSMYRGDFPELFKRVVANSSVFLYPYLLPPSPCRADCANKRYGYFISEDELIVLGLQQFSEYVEANPSSFTKPRSHPRKRWSLATAAQLTCRYMFPWSQPRVLLAHVHQVRRTRDRNNPIVKFFEENIIVPVKHRLVPFNPALTLYEQPEFEMPRIWIRYLAKSSKRFKDSLYRKSHATIQPSGVDVTSHILEPEQKKPLPIDFIKPITCNRSNLLHKTAPVLVNKVDVHITTQEQPVYVAANIYTLVQTSTGTQLVPLQVTSKASTAPCTGSTAPSTESAAGGVPDDVTKEKIKPNQTPNHCECCVLLRKIRKRRQSLITEYFKSNNKKNISCGCRRRKYPNITNKLKLLVNNYKATSLSTHNDLVKRIEDCKAGRDEQRGEDNVYFNNRDFVEAMKFQIKLMQRTGLARDNKMKIRVNNFLTNFDCEVGDPLVLLHSLYKTFDVELADLYNDLLQFLTPAQADQINKFKEYFSRSCLQDLMTKIDEQVKDNSTRSAILSQIHMDIYKNMSSCELCHRLLERMQDYPGLAAYTFDLFPHLWKEETESIPQGSSQQGVIYVTNVLSDKVGQEDVTQVSKSIPSPYNDTAVTCDETAETIDYEADGSSSSEDEADVTLVENDTNSNKESKPEDIKLVTTIKYEEIESPELTITKTEVQESSSDMSALMMSDDESVKSEPSDWKRHEDKLILQALKQYLTPEQIKDKTIIQVIEENLLVMIADNLIHKTLGEVKERVLYLLQVLGNET